jgi:hypothetical protein
MERHYVNGKAACTLVKLGSGYLVIYVSGSGSSLSPSSLPPHPRHQCITHKCLPFSPTSPPTFLTWLRRGDKGRYDKAQVLHIPKTSRGFVKFSEMTVHLDHCYHTFQTHQFTFIIFLKNNHSVNIIVGQDQKF